MDIPRLDGVAYLEPGTAIYPEDLVLLGHKMVLRGLATKARHILKEYDTKAGRCVRRE